VRSSTRLLRHLDVGDDQLMLRSSGGGLGWGVPAAIGAGLALPERPAIAIVGDGSYQFSVQAIWTAVQHRARLVAIVLDNGGYLAVKRAIEVHLGVPHDPRLHPGTRLPGIDHAGIARAYGATAATVLPGDLAAAVKQGIDAGGVHVIAVRIGEVRP
jgi:benzoylformate decarboxylase